MILQKEDSQALEFFILNFLNLKENHGFNSIELTIRPDCNQKCDYCYLYQHGDKIYPKELRGDNKQILSNIKLFLNFLLSKNIYWSAWELFAGDLFYDDLFFDIMDLFEDYFSEVIKRIDKMNLKNYNGHFPEAKTPSIVIPSNLSFCHDDIKIKKVQDCIDKFIEKYNVKIVFSYSTDGLYGVPHREKINLDDDWFDKTLAFCAKNNFYVHPMISYETIDTAIESYDWWIKKIKQHYTKKEQWMPPMLEVRNDGWTPKTINLYLKFLDYLIEDRLKRCNNDIELFTKHLFYNTEKIRNEHLLPRLPTLDPIYFHILNKANNVMTCALGHAIAINCATLELIPCHRLAYPYLAGGYFEVKNNEIVGIQAKENVNGYLNNILTNTLTAPGCNVCDFRYFCIKGCKGAQFEYSGDCHIPVPTVCDLFKSKIIFLGQKYKELGVFDILINNPQEFDLTNLDIERLITFLNRLENIGNDKLI